MAVRILPQNDPIEAVRVTTLQNLLPPMKTELRSFQRARAALSGHTEDISLEELLNRFDHLPARDRRRRKLVEAIQVSADETHTTVPLAGAANPLFNRLLTSTIEIEQYVEHLGAIAAWGQGTALDVHGIRGETAITAIESILSDPALASAYETLVNLMYSVPVPELSAFFEHLIELYGRNRRNFNFVLIFDQFEELFTRYVDPGPTISRGLSELPDWRLRVEFFAQFQRLYAKEIDSRAGAPVGNALKTTLPIRFVLSMRDEYIAQLDPIRRFVWDLDASSYHLGLLEREAARLAIEEPAKLFGYSYSPECYSSIVGQLMREGRFVEPSHLQIVCEKLWDERGRELATGDSREQAQEQSPEIHLSSFDALGGARGILKSFFQDYLAGIPPETRLETLELLEQLVTTSGTRNIVERDVLVNAPFRFPEQRASILSNLVRGNIVRIERRLGGHFVEITHEFLIVPILEALRDELTSNSEYGRFRWAIRALEGLERMGFEHGSQRCLSKQEFFAAHDNRARINWSEWALEIMVRSAILFSMGREILRTWVDSWSAKTGIDATTLFRKKAAVLHSTVPLSLPELRAVNEQRAALALSPQQTETVLRSQLAWSRDYERNDIVYWIGRLVRNES